MSKITARDVEFLKNKYKNLEKELESYKTEIQNLKAKTTVESIDDFYVNRKNETVIELNESKVQKVNIKNRLAINELVSGITVNTISSKYYPIKNKDGKVIDTTFKKFDVDASINSMKFFVSYISNQNFKDCFEDKVQVYKITKLDIVMKKNSQQNELKAVLEYFKENPSQLGLAMLCLKDYEELFNVRSRIKKVILEENPNFVESNLLLDENDKVYLEIVVKTEETKYFTLKWGIVWAESLKTVIDEFQVEIDFDDEDFLESVNHNFEKLTDNKIADIIISDINDDKMRKEIGNYCVLSETEKLKLIKNAILAAKASL